MILQSGFLDIACNLDLGGRMLCLEVPLVIFYKRIFKIQKDA